MNSTRGGFSKPPRSFLYGGRIWLSFAGLLIAILGTFLLMNRTVAIQEKAMPDQLDLGSFVVGSKIQFAARFLVSANKHPFDAAFDRFLRKLPGPAADVLQYVHPRRLRSAPTIADISTLKPTVELSSFINIRTVTPRQQPLWYDGRPFVVLDMEADTSSPGDFSGRVHLQLRGRSATLPVKYHVRESAKPLPRLLITSMPYTSDGTEDGVFLQPTAKLLSSAEMQIDLLEDLPEKLDGYGIVLLAETSLARLSQESVPRLQAFAKSGGRLIFACDAFYFGTAVRANDVVKEFGIDIGNKDYVQRTVCTNIVPDALTEGVHTLQFDRPTIMHITPPAKHLAITPEGIGSYLTVSRLPNGGEVIVLTQSLWWNWLRQFSTNSDNAKLMSNLLKL